MSVRNMVSLGALALLLAAGNAQAESLGGSIGVFAFPQEGQTAEQATTDDAVCYSWAVDQTGYNPATASAAPEQQGAQGHRLRGATRGAVGGAIIGEVADDDAGKGAAIGATLGTMRGGAQSRQAQAQAEQQAQAAEQGELEALKGAYGACMKGKGYSV